MCRVNRKTCRTLPYLTRDGRLGLFTKDIVKQGRTMFDRRKDLIILAEILFLDQRFSKRVTLPPPSGAILLLGNVANAGGVTSTVLRPFFATRRRVWCVASRKWRALRRWPSSPETGVTMPLRAQVARGTGRKWALGRAEWRVHHLSSNML